MRAAELKGHRVAIWGTGREGLAAAGIAHKANPAQPLVFIDEKEGPEKIPGFNDPHTVARDETSIGTALANCDILIKSPGVSLYHPLVQQFISQKKTVTSLINLWFAERPKGKTVCITGTKGKSTTSALLAHTLNTLGYKASLVGNIGTPVTLASDSDFLIIEMSSYQTTNFDGTCDLALVTALYPEHLDWHKSLEHYYRDKLNLFAHAGIKIASAQAADIAKAHSQHLLGDVQFFGQSAGLHAQDGAIYMSTAILGTVANTHLARAHNLANVCGVLAALKALIPNVDLKQALATMHNFKGLPHRQAELGAKDGVLYVDDSISTTPQSAIAAMEVYAGAPITLIAGGHDRGIDYAPLTDYIAQKRINAVICMGPAGERIMQALQKAGCKNLHRTDSMAEVVALARKLTPAGGVVLLSPAAPSFGLFKDYAERGETFARESGFK